MDKKDLTKVMIEEANIQIIESPSEYFLARANVIIGYFELKNWTVARSIIEGQKYNILPPRKSPKAYSIFIDDKELFSVLISKIASAYERKYPD